MRKIGILGGSFNPVHIGHLVLAEQACESLGLDQVILVPANVPPHKSPSKLASARDRLKMTRLAVAGNPRLATSDVELRRKGLSYTIDTITALRARFGDKTSLFFLIGADSIGELHTWREIRRLVGLCTFVPLSRPGAQVPSVRVLSQAVGREEAKGILSRMVQMPLIGVSSSDIRRRVCEGRSIRYMVPDAVGDYIRQKGLYVCAGFRLDSSPPRRCCGGASPRSSGRRRRAQG